MGGWFGGRQPVDIAENMRVAEEVMVEAMARKTESGSDRPEPMSKIDRQAAHNEMYRRKKLADFQMFLDEFENSGRSLELEEKLRRGLGNIYTQRTKTPCDMVMWLIHQAELENRGLAHVLPEQE